MTLTKMQAMLGVATGSLIVIGAIVDNRLMDERRFAALDTRLGKLESAIKALDAAQPDEGYKALIKELIAKGAKSGWIVSPKQNYLRFDSATHGAVCSFNGGPEIPCEVPSLKDGGNTWDTFPATAGAAADAPAVKVPQ